MDGMGLGMLAEQVKLCIKQLLFLCGLFELNFSNL